MKVFAFIVSFGIFLASLYCFSAAFQVQGYEALLFVAGILGVAILFALPFHLLPATDR